MSLLATKRNRNATRRGSILVEAAIVFPLLLLLTFGLLEYGWLFMKIEQVENAARQAARVGATANAKTADVSALVTSMMKDAGMEGKYTLTITPGAIEGSPTGTMKKGDMLKVSISVPYAGGSGVRLTGVPMLPLPATIGATITMTKEGPT